MKTFAFCVLTFALALAAFAPPVPVGFFAAPWVSAASSTVSTNGAQAWLAFNNNVNDFYGSAFTAVNAPAYSAGAFDLQIEIAAAGPSYAYHAADSRFDLGGTDYTLTCFVTVADNSVDSYPVAKADGAWEIDGGWVLVMQANNAFQFYSASIGSGIEWVTASTGGLPANGTRYFVAVKYNSTTKQLSISMNLGGWDSATMTEDMTNNAHDIFIGANDLSLGSVMNGSVDELRIYRRILNDTELGQLKDNGL